MTVPTTIDATAWLGKYLEDADGDQDLARAMLAAFAAPPMASAPKSGKTPAMATGCGPGIPGSVRSTRPCPSCAVASTPRSSCSSRGCEPKRP